MVQVIDFNNESWLQALILRTSSPLRRSLSYRLSPADIEDVLQETYLKVFVAKNDGRCDDVDAYAFRVARNLSIDVLRRQRTRTLYAESQRSAVVSAVEPVREVEDPIICEALLEDALNKLPPKCKEVFIARRIHECSHAEISIILGISQKTVENHLTKALKLMRNTLLEAKSTGR